MFLQIGKKDILNSYQNRCFLIIDSNNKKLIHHILHLGYILSSKQDKETFLISLAPFLYFEVYSSNASNIFLFRKTSSYLLKAIFSAAFLFIRFAFFTIIFQEWIHLWIQSSYLFNSDTNCLNFHLTNN